MPFSGAIGALVAFGFWAFCLFDFARTDERDMRTYPKRVWVLLLVFTSIFGGLLWLIQGRPQRR